MHPCSKGGHQPPGLCQDKHHQQVQGSDPFHLLSTCAPASWPALAYTMSGSILYRGAQNSAQVMQAEAEGTMSARPVKDKSFGRQFQIPL